MSDMSLPPLSLLPLDAVPGTPAPVPATATRPGPGTPAAPGKPGAQAEPPASADATPFVWPTPPDMGYPATVMLGEAEPCEIEGLNGTVTAGRLLSVDATAGVVLIQRKQARGPVPLKLTQFRRLTLMRPLSPLPQPTGTAFDDTTPLLPRRGNGGCRLRMRDGAVVVVNAIAHVDTPLGLFTFAPINDDGDLLRSFYPRPMIAAVEFDLRQPDGQNGPDAPHSPRRRAGDLLTTETITTPEQLRAAIEAQARMPMVRIGEALVALGTITKQQLSDALQEQKRVRNVPLGELLVRQGHVTSEQLQTALSRKMGYPVVDVNEFPVEPTAALRLPIAVARRLSALPLMNHAGRLVVAVQDPSARNVIDEIEFTAQGKVVPVLAPTGKLARAVDRVYLRLGEDGIDPGSDLGSPFTLYSHEQTENADKLLANLEVEQGEAEEGPSIEQSDNSLVRLINTMIQEARSQGVSDIHIECPPTPAKVQVRFRRDGVLRHYIELPASYRQAMVARIKIMCDLDISEKRKPQDGKINFGRWVPGQKLELRVATIPTAGGNEDVVMRLLASARALPLEGMGLQPDTLAHLKATIARPYGMVLCVGPTGSGKTTTLHAALAHLNTPDRKIWTAEDPVEITQPGLRQVQVNARIDWTFANALRAFLRADPDVVMVGEIRDKETAQMAIEASLTGHLVLSTLHTNSAPETVIRLLDMGMDPFSFADSLLAVLAQRLVRRWCPQCVASQPATVEETEMLLDEYLHAYPDPERAPSRAALLDDWTQRYGQDGVLPRYHAPGCKRCNDSGFSGRVGLHELLVISREQRHLIQTSAPAERIQAQGMGEGMRTLRQDGILKVLAGLTSIDEVRATSNS